MLWAYHLFKKLSSGNHKIKPEISQLEGGWHTYLESSQGFKEKDKKDYVKIEDNENLKKAYEFCLPYYQKLYEYRLRIE